MRVKVVSLVCLPLLCLFCGAVARGQNPENLLDTPLAAVFGAAPDLRGVRISPDGSGVSFIRDRSDGYSLVVVYDSSSGESVEVMAGPPDEYSIEWCGWANDERVLCGIRFVASGRGGIKNPRTRLVAVNSDGAEPIVLLDGSPLAVTQFQDRIADWLPDDAAHILLDLRNVLVRVDIYSGEFQIVERRDSAMDWIVDGSGNARVHATVSATNRQWYVRRYAGDAWWELHRTSLDDLTDEFEPLAFDAGANEVLFFDLHEGRRALFALRPDDERSRRLVYSHPDFDLTDLYRMGRGNRIVGGVTTAGRSAVHLFDSAVSQIAGVVSAEFPGMNVEVLDEDWAQRRYLVLVTGSGNPGAYYIFDTVRDELVNIARAFPVLSGRELVETLAITYSTADDENVPAYLSAPESGNLRAGIVFAGEPPPDLDETQFDYLSQFLAARGYTVLRTSYRGSDGYGSAWLGEGVFRDWERAAADIADGARYLVESDIVDAGRVCLVGWGYGAYAALQASIAHHENFQCVVSIAAATDPKLLAQRQIYYLGGRRTQVFIGSGRNVRRVGSPLRRADEIAMPVLLFHSRNDAVIPVEHSIELRDALLDAASDIELIEYENADHGIRQSRYRVDMLTRIGDFLDAYIRDPLPDFFSPDTSDTTVIETVEFGFDDRRPNGRCSDSRFTGADGDVLRDIEDRVFGRGDDATDCRNLFLSGEIVLREAFVPNFARYESSADRVTVFVDPVQQNAIGIATVDFANVDEEPGAPLIYARAGYRDIGVRAAEMDYRCVIRIDGEWPRSTNVAYQVEPVTPGVDVSQVRIPAFLGQYYRISASVVDDVLMLRVTDARQEEVIVDQVDVAQAGCG